MSAEIIDFPHVLAQASGLDGPISKEAAPLVHEIGFRIAELMNDIAVDVDCSREAFALAQAVSCALFLDLTAEILDQDIEDFSMRLMEAANRGLFDLAPQDASPRLQAILQQHNLENDNGES